MAVQSPGARVVDITELLEHILLDVKSLLEHGDAARPFGRKNSMRRMLRMQIVSRAFYTIIADSTKFKQHLFMATPKPRGTFALTFELDSNEALRGGPILRTEAVPFYFTWTTYCGELRSKDCPPEIADTEDYSKERDYVRLQVRMRQVGGSRASQAVGVASWRSMYLDQSAYRVLDIRNVAMSIGTTRVVKLDKLNPTAGEIYDALFKET